MVLVSPGGDLIGNNLPANDIRRVVELCGTAPQFHFLFWASHLVRFRCITDWPPNVSLALRITQQVDLAWIDEGLIHEIPYHTLWVIPEEDLALPDSLSGIHRVLVGKTFWNDTSSVSTNMAVRKLVGALLTAQQTVAVHIAKSAQPLFYQYP